MQFCNRENLWDEISVNLVCAIKNNKTVVSPPVVSGYSLQVNFVLNHL